MASLADAYVRIRPDTSGLDADGISKPASEMGKKAGEAAGKSFGISFGSLMKVAATAAAGIATGQIASFFKSTINAASDVAESTSKIGVVFGKNTKAVLDFGKQSSTSMGISQATYREAVGTLGNLFVALKLPGPQAVKMSTDMVKLSGDLASFNNTKPEEALDALKSALVGETEPLQRYGVNINAATLGTQAMKMGLIKHVNDALTPAQKATATYALILDQTKTAQGDFSRTQDGLANSTRIAAAQWDDLKAKIGEQFLPIAQKVFQWMKSEALPALDGFLKGLKGVNTNSDGLAGNLNIAGNAIKGFFDGLTGRKREVDGVVDTVYQIGKTIRDTGQWIKDNSDIIATAVGAYAAYVTAIGAYTTYVKAAAKATELWAKWQAVLDGTLAANPIGLIIGVVVGFIAIWITAYNRVKWFHDAVNWWFGHLYELAKWFVNGWKEQLNDLMPFLQWFGDGWSNTFSKAKDELTSFTDWFTSGWGRAFSEARPPAENFMTWFITGWSETLSRAKTSYNDFDVWFTQGWKQTFASAQSEYNAFDIWFTQGWAANFSAAQNQAQAFFTWFTAGWAANFSAAQSQAQAFFTWFTTGWTENWNAAKNQLSGFFSWFISGWTANFNEAKNQLQAFFSWFVSGWTGALNDARGVLSGFWAWFTSGWTSALASAASAVGAGVDAIGRFWDGLKEKARVPINFVVGFINRGIIGPVNSLVDVFGGTHVGQIPGLAGGGLLRGPGTGTSDSILGLSAGGAATARVSNGEFVVNAAQTKKHFGMLQAINSGVEGFALGGPIGDAIGLITDPVGTMSSGLGALSNSIGGNQFGQMLLGVPKKLIEWAGKWIKDKFTSLLGGGPAALGGPGGDSVAAILTWARMFDPTAQVSSGYRPGAADYHGAGLAADIIGSNMNGIAAGFYGMSGRLLELIHSPSWFVKNGARVGADFYRSVYAEHFNHVHVAAYANALGFANGGVIDEPIWGVGKSGRRYTFGENGPETVVPGVGGVGGGGGLQFNVHVHGDVSDAHVQQIKTHVNDAFSKFYVQLKTGRRR